MSRDAYFLMAVTGLITALGTLYALWRKMRPEVVSIQVTSADRLVDMAVSVAGVVQTERNELAKKIAALEARIEAAEAKADAAEQKVDELEAELIRERREKDQVKRENDVLKRRVDELEDEVRQLKAHGTPHT